METLFYIIVEMKVLDGMIGYSQFFVGDQKEFAADLFESLKGHSDPESQCVLRMNLIEKLPANSVLINTKACSLEELTENCRLITRETFKHLNLEK